MATLPWTVHDDPETGAEAVVLGSRLELRSFRDVPGFLRAALALRRRLRATAGMHGVSLVAEPARRRFWTLSAWRDEQALDAFVASPEHQAVMRRYHDRMHDSAFTTWSVDAASLPTPRSNAKSLWAEARARLAGTTQRAAR